MAVGSEFTVRTGVGKGMFPITPNDDTNLTQYAMSLYITTGGVVVAIGADGNTFTVTVPSGFILPVAVKRVKSTNTTAIGIFGIS